MNDDVSPKAVVRNDRNVPLTIVCGPDFRSRDMLQKTGVAFNAAVGKDIATKIYNHEMVKAERENVEKQQTSKEKAPKQAAKERGGKAL